MEDIFKISLNPPFPKGELNFPSLAKRGQGRFCIIYVYLLMNLLVSGP